jgi:transcriptional regulator with XRE-family HTH domain
MNLDESNYKEIGIRLKQARINAGLSIPDVSAQTQKSTGNLSELENGKYLPSTKALLLFSDIYRVSIDWILTGRTDTKIPSDNNPPSFFPDEELKPYFKKINELLEIGSADKQHMRGWIIIQLEKAFPEIAEEIKKDNQREAVSENE